ncbi:hypothetical protein SCHPADRAFT_301447 [Schizopora paradoxa]|uniref:Uncharacterized protein n=1 Tax=Schizopora paradoxa TaxID=27342 RepID=A0A0H2RRP7_9AGAM|nr:hypothetical protein SCHPADRAFT_301447 [Schizopora paradoxa]
MVVAVEEGRLQRGVHLTEIAIFTSGSGSVSPLSRDESDSSIRFNLLSSSLQLSSSSSTPSSENARNCRRWAETVVVVGAQEVGRKCEAAASSRREVDMTTSNFLEKFVGFYPENLEIGEGSLSGEP